MRILFVFLHDWIKSLEMRSCFLVLVKTFTSSLWNKLWSLILSVLGYLNNNVSLVSCFFYECCYFCHLLLFFWLDGLLRFFNFLSRTEVEFITIRFLLFWTSIVNLIERSFLLFLYSFVFILFIGFIRNILIIEIIIWLRTIICLLNTGFRWR